jgi:hypothetical protein
MHWVDEGVPLLHVLLRHLCDAQAAVFITDVAPLRDSALDKLAACGAHAFILFPAEKND